MVLSMTGYGKGVAEEAGVTVSVEIKTVNQRFLDINVKMPRILFAYEDFIKKNVQKQLSRGKVDLFVTFNDMSEDSTEVTQDTGLVSAYLSALTESAEKYGLTNKINSTDILRIPDAFVVTQKEKDPEFIKNLLGRALDGALTGLLEMRRREGDATCESFKEILAVIEKDFGIIKEVAPGVPAEYRNKLSARLSELMGSADSDKVDPQRLAQEVAIFADKCCIDEEITRFATHIDHFRAIITDSKEPVGKKLDFLIQEMNREVNTMGSKANDIRITNCVISLKCEIEKLREQVQNLE